ncbi:PREDICTED: uncharacterized protein LOC106814351 [Priapulus caudatus]|uniref:Uncharacterized protein LOC106814351 n=1 Tax=Priapulus caudatus TaxID=37621 RepID=A0ABM1EPM6_PRICU|nr:PREDICTED: uncharacterized protein LOC106814351 [Priapulus caudatus]
MSAQKLKAIILLGTVREGRLGLRVAKLMQNQLDNAGFETTLFDPLEMKFPLLFKPLHFYRDKSEVPEWLRRANQQILDATATSSCRPSKIAFFSRISFSAGIVCYSPGKIAFFSRISFSAGIVCYSPGIYGGMRAAMQLRAMLSECGMLTVSNLFGIPKVHEAIGEKGEPIDPHMVSGAAKLIEQLKWSADALKNHRSKFGTPTEPRL